MNKSKIAVDFAQNNDLPILKLDLRRVADTKNCIRFEAPDDSIVKSALYLKTAALAIFATHPDDIADEIEIVIRRKAKAQ